MKYSEVPLILWIVLSVFALGWLVLAGVVVKVRRTARDLDRDVSAIDSDLTHDEKLIKAHGLALASVQRAQAAQTNPMMAVVRPNVPSVGPTQSVPTVQGARPGGRHSRLTPPPRSPYA